MFAGWAPAFRPAKPLNCQLESASVEGGTERFGSEGLRLLRRQTVALGDLFTFGARPRSSGERGKVHQPWSECRHLPVNRAHAQAGFSLYQHVRGIPLAMDERE